MISRKEYKTFSEVPKKKVLFLQPFFFAALFLKIELVYVQRIVIIMK